MATETDLSLCPKCKKNERRSLNDSFCKSCSWDTDEDTTTLATGMQTIALNNEDQKNAPNWQTVQRRPVLSCYQSCRDCGASCRGTQCSDCRHKKTNSAKSENKKVAKDGCFKCGKQCPFKYCNECTIQYKKVLSKQETPNATEAVTKTQSEAAPIQQCETCSKKIAYGRFCQSCKNEYHAKISMVFCQSCGENQVRESVKYCASCRSVFKKPKECLACSAPIQQGYYCYDCFVKYKTQLQATQVQATQNA